MTKAEQRRLAVLGRPIEHSLSPVLHRAAYEALQLPWQYERAEVGSGDLLPFLNGLGPEWLGLSLTMPLKREVLPYLDEVTPLADELQVANTLRIASDGVSRGRERVLQGANTDVWGIVQALRGSGVERVSTAEVLGSGATALSAIRALADLGATSIRVHARTPERAQRLVDAASEWDVWIDVLQLQPGVFSCVAPVTVSTLPAGAGDTLEPVFVGAVSATQPAHAHPVLLDVAYDPWPSCLAQRWTDHGGIVVSGVEMLLWQAVAQVRFFLTGDDRQLLPDERTVVEAMRSALNRHLPE